jgi:hypothetical protein
MGMGPSFAWMVHMLQMCFYDFAPFCAAPELCDDGVRACFSFLFFAIPFILEQI